MRSLFKKIVAVLAIGLILLGIARTSQVHKMARGIGSWSCEWESSLTIQTNL